MKKILINILLLIIGVIIGGYLFKNVQPRSFLAVNKCQDNCYKLNDLAGLAASAGIQKVDDLIPFITYETDKTLVIRHPLPEWQTHLVIIPKKDIKDASDFTNDDKEYLNDAYAVIGKLIKDNNLKNYKVITNGPGLQQVTYLHFHLLAKEKTDF